MKTKSDQLSSTETPPNLPRLAYNIEETAEMLGVSQTTIYRLLQRGLLRSVGGIRHKVIPLSEIQKLLKN